MQTILLNLTLQEIQMNTYQHALNLIGRVLIAALFLPAGINKLTNFEGTVGYFTSLGVFAPAMSTVVVIAIEILGGVALILGFRTTVAALVLAVFTLVASFIGHAYWAAPADQAFIAQLLFFKNIAVIGGLLALASAGAGKFGLENKKIPA